MVRQEKQSGQHAVLLVQHFNGVGDDMIGEGDTVVIGIHDLLLAAVVELSRATVRDKRCETFRIAQVVRGTMATDHM
eukprot:CAMPEP_0114436412 /NCGR_PEP_ID=MMETSP0103-20121206/13437_1 /TAXON_ID=37642 ORGANISM="Paraphysomonas imperforata, Strain PA2" /NCGR_SAMPLE_ID=MMETSP0103 /ASSEMBLY_ACC=CAM_ASM_000201 /LENGTH=76 /DNA_ID=CAMNT_0001606677 /DNA_START=8 /DNA_END=238 /DNA_ORIENTATION=+